MIMSATVHTARAAQRHAASTTAPTAGKPTPDISPTPRTIRQVPLHRNDHMRTVVNTGTALNDHAAMQSDELADRLPNSRRSVPSDIAEKSVPHLLAGSLNTRELLKLGVGLTREHD